MQTDPGLSLPDTEHRALARSGPLRPFILLARLDRPIGWWLLFWPCAWGVALAGAAFARFDLILWFLLGSIAMRGAGCVYNDIVDRDLDAQVARTRRRPLPSGQVSVRAAWAWLLILCGIGLVVLVQLPLPAALVALASLVPVAAYPFMKRITWWPQLWLGLVFSWGALVGWAAIARGLGGPALWLYAGAILWVTGYDTIYALQDLEDDALAGIKSSARRLGRHVRAGIALWYFAALACWSVALWLVRPDPLAPVALAPAALHLGWQVSTLRAGDPADALLKFRSNRFAGLLVFLACVTVGTGAG